MNIDPKEKARELIYAFLYTPIITAEYEDMPKQLSMITKLSLTSAKDCALISINDKIEELMLLELLVTLDNPIKNTLNEKIEELKIIQNEIKIYDEQ